MDSGDIIYLLLMIGAVIISIVKKKLDDNKPVAKPEKSVPDTLDDPFPDFKNWMDDNQVPETDSPLETLTTLETIRKPSEPVFTYDQLDPADTKPLLTKDTNKAAIIAEDTTASGEEFQFNMRQAVIYQAILHRPDY